MGHSFTPEERSRGGFNVVKIHPHLRRKRALFLRHDSEAQRAKAYLRMEIEQDVARQLVEEGWTIYSPTVVCDRIGVKDGRVYFLEFMNGDQELLPGQKSIMEPVPKMYLVIRHD